MYSISIFMHVFVGVEMILFMCMSLTVFRRHMNRSVRTICVRCRPERNR